MPYNKVTLLRPADAEIVEKKSRFIGHAAPVKSEAEAMSFVEKIRAEYSDATHNVWAYYLNGGASARCSDDGEPQGSSGYLQDIGAAADRDTGWNGRGRHPY